MESAIVQILRNQPGIFFCDACLALKVEMSLQEAQAAVGRLDRYHEFTIVQGQCSECLRTKVVVAAAGGGRPARIA